VGLSRLKAQAEGRKRGLRQSRSFDSRQLPVAHDDGLRRGEFTPRGLFGSYVIAVIADIARNRKSKTYHGGAETRRTSKIG